MYLDGIDDGHRDLFLELFMYIYIIMAKGV